MALNSITKKTTFERIDTNRDNKVGRPELVAYLMEKNHNFGGVVVPKSCDSCRVIPSTGRSTSPTSPSTLRKDSGINSITDDLIIRISKNSNEFPDERYRTFYSASLDQIADSILGIRQWIDAKDASKYMSAPNNKRAR